jgi:hypothetical protein
LVQIKPQELLGWKRIYNIVRQAQALGCQTPQQFVAR